MVATERVTFFYPAPAPVKGQIMSTTLSHNTILPETGFLRQSHVLTFVPISKSTLWRRVLAGTFPAPVKLSSRITAWRVEDVRRWIEDQGAQT
jgi:predicted DNA-binding transcriptional regulator AlpA